MSGKEESNCIIRNGTVIDGTGAPRFGADVAIAGDRIAAVGGSSLRAKGAREIDARGMIVKRNQPGSLPSKSSLGRTTAAA
jgi:N-acyl-D-aspartate/D-glutamate deacylase